MEWKCPKCEGKNFGYNCRKCRTPKPVPHGNALSLSAREKFLRLDNIQSTISDTKVFHQPTPFKTARNQLVHHEVSDIKGNKPTTPFKTAKNPLNHQNDNFKEFIENKKITTKNDTKIASPAPVDKKELLIKNKNFINKTEPEIRKLVRNWSPIGKTKSKSSLKLEKLPNVISREKGTYAKTLKQYSHQPFSDDDFATNRSSLYRSTDESNQQYDSLEWKRVSHIYPNNGVNLCVRGSNSSNVVKFKQGILGDCWFLAALCSLVWSQPKHLELLLPDEKAHNKEGVYQVFLCLDGKWQSILIDDYFPCDTRNHLAFAQAINNQLFAPILEKALAKHHQSYNALRSGSSLEGFATLTGMPCKRVEIKSISSNDLWNQLEKELKGQKYLVTASCDKECNGIHNHHSYSVLDVTQVPISGRMNKSVLLSNPWGNQELSGQLLMYNQAMHKQLNSQEVQGLFWLSFDQFAQCFAHMDVCLYNTRWHKKRFEFSLPFSPKDEKNFTVFLLDVDKVDRYEFTTYHKVHRDMQLNYHVTYSLVVFKQWPDGSIQLVDASPAMYNQINHYSCLLGPGKYLVVAIGFNHWGQTARLKETPTMVLATHCTSSFEITALGPDMNVLGDMLIALALGSKKEYKEKHSCIRYEVGSSFACGIFMFENTSETSFLRVDFDCSTSSNTMVVRSNPKTVDIIPPKTRQIVAIYARETDKQRGLVNSAFSVLSVDVNSTKYDIDNWNYHEDVKEMSCLFAPRNIAHGTHAEKNKDVKFDFTEVADSRWRCNIL